MCFIKLSIKPYQPEGNKGRGFFLKMFVLKVLCTLFIFD